MKRQKKTKLKDIIIIDKTTIKFLGVGIVNTIIGTGVMFILYNVFCCSYWISSAGNYIVGSIVSFLLNKYFTFQSRKRSFLEMFKFVINIAACYFLAYGAAKPAIRILLTGANDAVQDNIAMLLGMCIFVVLNYMGQRYFVFKPSER